jgi:hypothetical protein
MAPNGVDLNSRQSSVKLVRLSNATKSLQASIDSLAPPTEIKRLLHCDCVAGLERPDDSRVRSTALRFKPVDLGAPDWDPSRQPEIVCELFDRPDITSFLRTWVFVNQIRVIVHLASCMDFVPRSEKLRSVHFRKSAHNGCKGNAAVCLQASHCLQPRSAAFV